MIWTPKDYQRIAVDEMLEKPRAMAWFKPGDGKTSMTLAYFAELKSQGLVNKALLVAPLRVAKMTWPDEISKWANFCGIKYAVLHGTDRDKLLMHDVDLYIINYEGLAWLLSVEKKTANSFLNKRAKIVCDATVLASRGIDMLIIDELSKCKQGSAQQTKLVHEISKGVNRVIGLTGSPSPNGLLDVFSQTLCVDLGQTFGRSFYKFREKYFYTEPYKQYTWHLKDGAEDEIMRALSPIVIQRREERKEYTMPELFIQKVFIDMPEDALTNYLTMQEDFVVAYQQGFITASNAAVKTLKLRQISNGALYVYSKDAQEEVIQQLLDSGGLIAPTLVRETVLLHHAKAKALKDLITKQNGKPLLVFYNFDHDIELIRNQIGDVFVLNKEKNQEEIIKYWNEGAISVMLLHPRSGGHGLNLQLSGADVCWYSPEWSNELNEQGNRRVWRQGNPSSTTNVYYLLCNNTLDEHVLNTLTHRADRESKLMTAVAEYVKSLNVIRQ